MDDIQIDWLIVVIAAMLNLCIRFIWYSRWLFGSLWAKWNKCKEKDLQKDVARGFVGEFVVSVIIAYFLSFFEAHLGISTVMDGMFLGFLFWLAFVASTQISCVFWTQKSWKLFVLDTGYKLLSFLVMSGVIAA